VGAIIQLNNHTFIMYPSRFVYGTPVGSAHL